ncbi:MAG: thioredoxin family protein, partial [Gemmatimonadetes bacterium]|nr:thioredoxin family protein [Gemmatimonadota bacterium]
AWNDHYANAQVPDALRTRVTALPGSWRLLVVAEDWCGDSANTIPYVAKLVDAAGNLDMRIINSTVGRAIMESHRTPDGRAATPTVILLTEHFEEAGCFVERPRHLQHWWLSNEDKLSRKDLLDQKYAWYAEDQGQETLEEIVAMIEAASGGDPVCTG